MLKKVATKLGISEKECNAYYKYYWLFIKETIEALPLKEINEDQFKEFRTSINLPKIGKLYCSCNKNYNINKDDKIKKSNTSS